MPPYPGSIHRRPRSDSGAAKLWAWARRRRAPWTTLDAADAADISPRRARAIVRALGDAGLLDCLRERDTGSDGYEAALWALSDAGRALVAPPILVVDHIGPIAGVRMPGDGAGNVVLRDLIERSGLSTRAASRVVGLNDSTLRRIMRGTELISDDDPVIARARSALRHPGALTPPKAKKPGPA